jgi:sn-glycerol 3-phosphate transport system substrate-binding protein
MMNKSVKRMWRGVSRAIMALVLVGAVAGNASAAVEIEFWHGLTSPLGDLLEGFVEDFNASQDEFHIEPSFKGGYADTMVAAIAASRAGNAPHIVQMFEVGTATMMAAGPAIKPVYELFEETGVAFDPEVYIPAIKGYFSLPDGRMMSMPFNSSTSSMWINRDLFAAAGLDPDAPLETWAQVRAASKQIVDSGVSECGFASSWPTWLQFEQMGALHNEPIATLANGMEGLGAELTVNSPFFVNHVQNLLDMQAEGSFTYAGRDSAADALFPSGECAIVMGSSAMRARIMRDAEFDWDLRALPFYDDVVEAPLNSIIGGASFWVMTAPSRTADEYRGIAEFFNYISQPEVVTAWHTQSGYLPIVYGVFEELQESGFYAENPGLDVPYLQLTSAEPTENSRGPRLGNMVELRNIIQEELELALQGQQTAQQALDNATSRGNTVLRAFERANR